MKAVWPDSFVSEDSLTQSIWALRRALGDHSNQPTFVATVPRRGYRFVAPVTVPMVEHPSTAAGASTLGNGAPSLEPSHPATPAPALAPLEPLPRGRSRYRWATAAIAVLAIAGMLAFNRGTASPIAAPVRTSVPAPIGTSIVSGAVVSPDSQYLA